MAKNPKNPPSPPINLRTAVAGKPDLVVHTADLPATARALAKLLAEKCDSLFVHNHKVVIIGPGDDANDLPTMRPAGANEIIIAAHRYCQPVKPKSANLSPVTLRDKVAELYLAEPKEWCLRPLRGMTTAPILHDDGSIRWEPGYDADTRLFCACNVPAIDLPENPTKADAEDALKTLRRAFRTFAFADRIEVDEIFSDGDDKFIVHVVDLDQPPGNDESAQLHALLGAVARFSLPQAPGYCIVAPPHSGSRVGKGKLEAANSIIAYGKQTRPAGLGEKKEEFDKGLNDELLSGKPSILIDNLNNVTLRSRQLSVALGAPDADLRKIGAGMAPNRPATITITGNGLKLAEDLVPRFITCELDAKCEDPEQRRFAGDFLADIKRERRGLLRAVLIIWRWGRQTKLKKGAAPLGGFEQWTEWVRDPLIALGCQDPVAQIAKAKAADPDRRNKAEAFHTWAKHHGLNKTLSSDLHYDVQVLLIPNAKKGPTRQAVASRLSKLVGTRIAGYRLCSDQAEKKKGDKGWWTPALYWLERTDENKQGADAPPAAKVIDLFGSKASAPKPPPHAPTDNEMENIAKAEMAHGGWRPKSGSEAATETKSETKYAGGIPLVMTNVMKAQLRLRGYSDEQIANLTPQEAHDILDTNVKTAQDAPPAEPITAAEMDELRQRGFSGNDLFDMNPKRAREIIADPRYDNMPERFRVGPKTAEPCPICDKTGARMITSIARRETVALHLRCAALYYEDETSAPEPEAAGESSEEDDPDGYYFNREPAAARPAASPAAPPPPSDGFNAEECVALWRNAFASLNPQTDPCPGYQAGEWPRAHACGKQFLSGPLALAAARAGWSAVDLFGIHKITGVAARDCIGALTGNTTNGFVARIEADALQFTNGTKVRKRSLDSNICIPIWSFRAR